LVDYVFAGSDGFTDERIVLKAPHDYEGRVKIKPPAQHESGERAVHFLDVSAELRLLRS
jgi:hypothetical protein